MLLSLQGKEKKPVKPKERTHVGLPGVPARVGVFWWHVLKTCHWHQSMCIPAPSIPSLSPFQFLVCFAGLVSAFARTPLCQSIPFPSKDGLLRSGGWQAWAFPSKSLPSKAGCSLGSMAGAGELSTDQSQAGLRWCQARWLLGWDLCLCTDLSTEGCVLQHLPAFFPLISEAAWQRAAR